MSVQVQTVPINTLTDGSLVRDVRLGVCRLLLAKITQGDLEAFDLTVTDEPEGRTLLALTGVSDDARYQLTTPVQDDSGGNVTGEVAPPIVAGRVHVVVASGGNKKTGELTIVYER